MPTGRLYLVLYICQASYVGIVHSAQNNDTIYTPPIFNQTDQSQSSSSKKNETPFIQIRPEDSGEETNEDHTQSNLKNEGTNVPGVEGEATTEVAVMDDETDTSSTTNGTQKPPRVLSPDALLYQAERGFSFHLGTLALSVPRNKLNEPEFQWHVTIYYRSGSEYEQICGASLVTKNVAISAAHCFWDDTGLLPAENFAAASAKYFRRWTELRINKSNITEIIIPPRFLGAKTNFQDDIAVVKLETPFKYEFGAKPLCVDFDADLDRKQLTDENYGTITGFGLTEENGEPSKVLNFQRLPYVDITACINASDPDFLKYLTSDKICAGDQVTGRALCKGDSGGGLVFFAGNITFNVPYLRGIASAAPRNKNKCNAFAIGTFTHLRTHRTFLRENIPGLEAECPKVYAEALAEIAKNVTNNLSEVVDSSLFGIEFPGAVLEPVSKPAEDNSLFQSSPDDDEDSESDDDIKEGDKEVEGDINDPNYLRTLPKIAPRIGESTAPAIEWHVTVYRKTKRPYEQVCGGTLVKTNMFISAAHCFFNETQLLPAKQFAAAVGKIRRPWGDIRDEYAQYSDVKQIKVPKTFKTIKTHLRSCYQHDIAVGRLSAPFTYGPGVQPACVDFTPEFDRNHLQPGRLGAFAGFGHTQDNCKPYPHMYYRELPYVDLGCTPDFKLAFFFEESTDICGGLVALLSSKTLPAFVKVRPPCATDSGGGLVYLEGSSTDIVPYLRGVATTSPRNDKCNLYIIDSFVHLREEREFLKAVIPGIDEECSIAYPVIDSSEETGNSTMENDFNADSDNSDAMEKERNKTNEPDVSANDKINHQGSEIAEVSPTDQKYTNKNDESILNNNRPDIITTTTTEEPKTHKIPNTNEGFDGKRRGVQFTGNPNINIDLTSKVMNLDKIPFVNPSDSNRPVYTITWKKKNRTTTEMPMEPTESSIHVPDRKLSTTEKPVDSYPIISSADVPQRTVTESTNSGTISFVKTPENTATENKMEDSYSIANSLEVPVNNTGVSFPWHVGVYSKAWTPYMQICGGSLVKRDAVLSAAHCFWSDEFGAQSPAQFAVAAGKRQRTWIDSRDRDAQYSHVRELIFPDRFLGVKTNFQDDIAVVRLDTPFEYSPYVKPVCVEFGLDAELLKRGTGMLPGWGLSENDGNPSQSLNYVELPYVEVKQCIRDSERSSVKYITSDKFCAGDRSRGAHLCRSDGGGGLVYNSSHPILRGISSHTFDGLCTPITLQRFTQISSHASFLRENVKDVERECFDVYGRSLNREVVKNDGLNGFSNAHFNLVCNCNCDESRRYRP